MLPAGSPSARIEPLLLTSIAFVSVPEKLPAINDVTGTALPLIQATAVYVPGGLVS